MGEGKRGRRRNRGRKGGREKRKRVRWNRGTKGGREKRKGEGGRDRGKKEGEGEGRKGKEGGGLYSSFVFSYLRSAVRPSQSDIMWEGAVLMATGA